jgi:hypothetical protein
MSRLEIAIEQIERVRKYANSLLDNIDEADWFRQPAEGVTHIAWQVGHMTLSQYRLALRRIRGELATDAEFVPAGFQKLFGKGSTPSSDRSIHPIRS